MKDIFYGGHRQLIEAQCCGLSAAWRRAAASSAEPRRGRSGARQAPRPVHGTRAWLATAAVILVVGMCLIAVIPQEAACSDSSATAQPTEQTGTQASSSAADALSAQLR